jgi:hypothetical protein
VALAKLIELSAVLGESGRVPEWGARLRQLVLTKEERHQAESAITEPAVLEPWLPDTA